MNTSELVSAYLNIRNERERLQAEWEAEDKELKNQMATIEQMMLTICNDTNATSIKTDAGTVIKSLKERYTLSDREFFNKYVREHDAIELFEGRIHQGNFKEFIKERMDEGLPPGVNVMREFTITVRKPATTSV
jgi:hypothetical protein